MGNNPSKTPSTGNSAGSAAQNLAVPGNDKRVHRRVSNHGLKASAADPSASKDSATGQPAPNTQAPVQQRLQSRNISDDAGRLDRSDSRKLQRHRSLPKQDPSDPVQVPSRPAAKRDVVAPSGPPLNTYYGASAHLQRPPRLPLPIGDSTATPGSPVIAPADPLVESIPWDTLDEPLTRQQTTHRGSAIDEDEVIDDEQSNSINGVGKAVPTNIEWRGPGEKVYVTGTFVNWEKKFRLHRRYASIHRSSNLHNKWDSPYPSDTVPIRG